MASKRTAGRSPGCLSILKMTGEGKARDEEIAQRLHFSTWTVRKYVKILMEKTNFKSRTQLTVSVRESGLVIKEY